MKVLKKLLILLCVASLLASCSSTSGKTDATPDVEIQLTESEVTEEETEATEETLIAPIVTAEEEEAEIAADSVVFIDSERRAVTNLDLTLFEMNGYDYGDIFAVQAGDAFFYAPLVPGDASVSSDAWYMSIEDGKLLLGRKDGETGLTVGTPIQYALNSKGGYSDAIILSALYPVNTELTELNSYAAGALRANTLFTIYLPMLTMENMEKLTDLIIENNIKTVIDLTGKVDSYQVSAYLDLVDFYAEADLAAALRIVMNTSKPYLLILDESTASIMIAPILESVMGARLEDILIDCVTPYSDYYGVKQGDPAYEVMSNMIVNYFTDLNGGEEPVNKSLLSISVNYLRYELGLSIDEVSSLRASLR